MSARRSWRSPGMAIASSVPVTLTTGHVRLIEKGVWNARSRSRAQFRDRERIDPSCSARREAPEADCARPVHAVEDLLLGDHHAGRVLDALARVEVAVEVGKPLAAQVQA